MRQIYLSLTGQVSYLLECVATWINAVYQLFCITKAGPLLLKHIENCRYSYVVSCWSFMFLNLSPFKHFKSCGLDLNITAKTQNCQISNKNAMDVKSLPCRSNYKISESVAPGIHTGEGFSKVWEPSPAIAETAREKKDSISWGQRPVPAYERGNFCPILQAGPPSERLLKATQNPNTGFLAIP